MLIGHIEHHGRAHPSASKVDQQRRRVLIRGDNRTEVCRSPPMPNDPIGGTIGPAQYAQWRANFGQTAIGSGSNTIAAVPEPATIVPIIMATIAMCFCQRAIVS